MIAAAAFQDHRRALGGAALLVTALMTLGGVVQVAAAAWAAFNDPFELDYGEGIVWWQMLRIASGQGYAPIGVIPGVAFHYPPVYHLVTAALAALTGADPLLAGRILSFASAMASVLLIARLAFAIMPQGVGAKPALIAAALAGCVFACSPTVRFWSTLLRVDLLACALTLAGLWLTAEAMRRPSRSLWAALVFALAVYTKQTAVIGPAAASVALWVVRPRTAVMFFLTCAGLSFAALAALQIGTDGGFLRHVLLYNVNRLDLDRWRLLAEILAGQSVVLVLAAIAAGQAASRLRAVGWSGLRAHVAAEPADGVRLLALAYLIGRVATLPLILKSGSSDNYLIDLFAAAAIFVGPAVAPVVAAIWAGTAWPRPVVVALTLAGLSIQNVPRLDVGRAGPRPVEYERLLSMIRDADGPVVSDDMVLLMRAGRPVLLEPAIVAELAHKGLYDEAGLVRLIRARAFAFFVTAGRPTLRMFPERYNPAVAAAIAEAYPEREWLGGLTVHRPAAPPGQARSGGVASDRSR